MLRAHCNGTSIAESIGVAPDTLYKRVQDEYGMTFSAYAQLKKAEGQDMLRLKQFQAAMEGDRVMLIWLGKQYLGQSDRVEQTLTVPQMVIQPYNAENVEELEEAFKEIESMDVNE